MSEPNVNQTICHVKQLHYTLQVTPCDRCQQPAPFFTQAQRHAIDVHLDHPVLLQLTVSVHYCAVCEHYFRAQPPFLQRGAIYTNQVIEKAVHAVYEDGMAMRKVPTRMARDFWVCPSEGSVRRWCRHYSQTIDFVKDYQCWVVSEFSGILCVDEVYQDQLALLLAVDPAATDGDRLVGYELIHGSIDSDDMAGFLSNLHEVGVEPDEVITDGSQLYPSALAKVWPHAAHQLCLFHETRHVTRAVMKVVHSIRRGLPSPPPASGTSGGSLGRQPPSNDPDDPSTQRWYWRQAQRHAEVSHIHELAQRGLSQRAIARQTGRNRRTIQSWLSQPIPELPADMPEQFSEMIALPVPTQRKLQKLRLKQRVHTLSQEGLSHSAIGRQVGIHRVTVKSWLEQSAPTAAEVASLSGVSPPEEPSPPDGWSSWEQVRQVRESLWKHRFLLVHRPEHLDAEEQEHVASLLRTPVGGELGIAYDFLKEWYALWTDESGQRRELEQAQQLYETWREHEAYQQVPQLRRVQTQMTDAKFTKLSQFLRDPAWESTNNGAERTGRAFRHRQAPHYNLRTEASIKQALDVTACLRKEAATRSPSEPFHTCQRGRKKQRGPQDLENAMAA